MTTQMTETAQIDVRPFRAYRYNPNRVDFKKVIAPPYDVISPAKQDHLYGLSPFNVVRLILNKKEPADDATFNTYSRARDAFNGWIQEQVLMRDDTPCFYIYRQSYKAPDGPSNNAGSASRRERYALLGKIKAEPFEKGLIIPHEKTLKGPRADRMNLIKMIHANLSPVFGLYQDQGGETYRKIAGAASGAPVFDLVDEDGIGQTMWVVSDPAICKEISESLRDKKIYIADGHHRYETSLEYSQVKRAEEKTPPKGSQPYDYTLMAFVSFSDPGFMVMPTHRLMIQLTMPQEQFLKALDSHFKIDELNPSLSSAPSAQPLADEFTKLIDNASDLPVRIGLVFKDKSYLLTLKDPQAAKKVLAWDKPDICLDLNVNILGHLVFAKLLNFPEDKWEGNLKFEHEANPAIEAVKKGEVEAAFILKAAPIAMLEKLGAVQERMPQKSTYFYPKLASGIVFHHHSV